jgi:hypothetical protein
MLTSKLQHLQEEMLEFFKQMQYLKPENCDHILHTSNKECITQKIYTI